MVRQLQHGVAMRRLLPLLLVTSLVPGCTLVGAVAGASMADTGNATRVHGEARGENPGPVYSVGKSAAASAAVGFVIDLALVIGFTYAAVHAD